MGKVVTLRLYGNLDHQGVRVDVEVGTDGKRPDASFVSQLSPAPELAKRLTQWEQDYWTWGVPYRIRPKGIARNGSSQIEVCRQSAEALKTSFVQWLNSSEFLRFDLQLRQQVQPNESVLVMLRTQSEVLRKLPWHLWEFIEEYAQAELVLGATTFKTKPISAKPPTDTVRILAILGNADDIDIESDRTLLQSLPNAKVSFLVEPEREAINDQFWEQAWDILFFAGHSQTEGEQGRIFINKDDSLTLAELNYGLKIAVQQGLQLAIFNSCDGLGLAYELEQLSLPHMIVMKEPVPDKVAHAFLTHFLQFFSQGDSLYQAVRKARKRLQGMEKKFPCATWLPIIYQHPLSKSPTWRTLSHLSEDVPLSETSERPRSDSSGVYRKIVVTAITSIIVTSLIVGVRALGLFQTSELSAYDHFMYLRPKPFPDERLFVITVDKDDIDYQDASNKYERREGWSLSDQALAEVLQTIGEYQPRAVGLDIAHPYPFDASVTSVMEQYNLKVVAACVVGNGDTLTDDATPPPGFGGDNLGFADIPIDPDGIIRRQLPLMAAGDPCQTSRALSLQLVHQYLADKNLNPVQKLPNGDRAIGGYQNEGQSMNARRLRRFQYNTGGYQLPTGAANGYQILLNYRYRNPITVPLRTILSPEKSINLAEWVEDRIVLIGVNQSQQDRHDTAINQNIPGVMIHAHMISQLLDIVLENKSQLWWWPQWAESIWIAIWAIIGGSLVLLVRSYWKLGFSIFTTVMTLYGLCWILFTQDGWIPLVPTAVGVLIAATTVAITIRSKIFNHYSK